MSAPEPTIVLTDEQVEKVAALLALAKAAPAPEPDPEVVEGGGDR